MLHDKAKQVVILKDIKSSIFEEAIFVLKNNTSLDEKRVNWSKKGNDSKNGDYIIKEAQDIIDKYIKQYSPGYIYGALDSKKSKVKKKSFSIGVILNIALIVSITLFLFLLSRAF